MKVIDFLKTVNRESDEIPVEVRCWPDKLIATSKSLYHYAAHGGIELDDKISRITIEKNKITIYVK